MYTYIYIYIYIYTYVGGCRRRRPTPSASRHARQWNIPCTTLLMMLYHTEYIYIYIYIYRYVYTQCVWTIPYIYIYIYLINKRPCHGDLYGIIDAYFQNYENLLVICFELWLQKYSENYSTKRQLAAAGGAALLGDVAA